MGHPPAVNPANPQSWNHYAYVGGNPLIKIDPLGLVTCGDEGQGADTCVDVVASMPPDVGTILSNLPGGLGAGIVGLTGGSIGGPIPVHGPGTGGGGGRKITPAPKPACPSVTGISKSIPHGFTWGVSGNASGGLPPVGAMADGSVGAGLFISQAGQVSGGMSASGGASVFAGSHNASAPQQSKISPFALGAYAGGGTFVGLTNAQSMNQLSGPFAQWNANIGFGPGYSLTFQYDNKSGIWNFSISQGPGWGLSGTAMTTTTAVKTNPATCQ